MVRMTLLKKNAFRLSSADESIGQSATVGWPSSLVSAATPHAAKAQLKLYDQRFKGAGHMWFLTILNVFVCFFTSAVASHLRLYTWVHITTTT